MHASRLPSSPLAALLALSLALTLGQLLATPHAAAEEHDPIVVTRGDDPEPGDPGQCGDEDDGSRDDCSLRQAVRLANADAEVDEIVIDLAAGDTVTLTRGWSGNDDAAWGDLDVHASVTIRGVGMPTIDASETEDDGFPSRDRVFDVHGPDVTLTLEDLAVTGGVTDEVGGGAVRAHDASLVLDGVVLHDNEALGESGWTHGGAVMLDASGDADVRLEARDSEFTGNYADWFSGGAIRIEAAGAATVAVELLDTSFTDNEAFWQGGALSVDSRGSATVDIDVRGTDFVDNRVDYSDGGAIFLDYRNQSSGTVTFDGIEVRGNSAPCCGGGLWIRALNDADLDLAVVDSVVADNTAGGIWGAGLALLHNSATPATWRMADTVISGNVLAGNTGGGMYVHSFGLLDLELARVEVEDNHLTEGAWGGGIHSTNTALLLVDSVVANNSVVASEHSGEGGGGLWVSGTPTEGDSLTVINSTISGNEANRAHPEAEAYGGGVYLNDARAVFHHTTFADNSAPDGGDALFLRGAGSGEMAHVTLTATVLAAGDSTRCDWSGMEEAVTIVDAGGNLADDDSCYFDEGDVHADLGLEELTRTSRLDGPGATLVHPLAEDSPVVDHVDGEQCAENDQRGAPRDDEACAAGAFEPIDLADLTLDKQASVAAAEVGDTFTYTLTVTNDGPEPATGVTVTDELPDEVSHTGHDGTCTHTDGTVTCDLDDLAAGGSASVEVTVEAVAAGEVENAAWASSNLPDPDEARARDSAVVTVTEPEDTTDPDDPVVPDDPEDAEVTRLSGTDRIETAIAISQDLYGPGEAQALVLARADQFADALAGTPLAIRAGAPLLLTGSSALDGRTETEIDRVLAAGGTVYLLGGNSALAPAVAARVEDEFSDRGAEVVRLAGATRFETAIEIAEHIGAHLGGVEAAMLVTAFQFPDAITAGAASAATNGVVVLAPGTAMHPHTQAYLNANPELTRYALGGPASQADPDAVAIVGATRFETAAAVADAFFEAPAVAGVATGVDFADSLTGGAHVGALGGPLLLSAPDQLHPAAHGYLEDRSESIVEAYLYGGTGALSPQVQAGVEDALG